MESSMFEFNGRTYEIRANKTAAGFCVRVFIDDKPANGFLYCIDSETEFDLNIGMRINSIDHLACLAKEDVLQKRWDAIMELSKSA